MKFRNSASNQKGQTAVEYMLMLAVMASIITSLLSYIRVHYLGDMTKCDSPANKKSLLCKINNIVAPQGGNKRFQYVPFKKS